MGLFQYCDVMDIFADNYRPLPFTRRVSYALQSM